ERNKIIAYYEIVSINTQGKEVVCETKNGAYRLKKRLYELKKLLPSHLFLQIFSSEIVNFSCIQEFALTRNGIYQVILQSGKTTYTSRRYMQEIRKEYLS
ncbi:LytTR family transcriptional regulator, partial [Lactobacillus sp. XV13L]|nr:LytTR family transcriptional regulator [Lactobacillus sp. XV13L]